MLNLEWNSRIVQRWSLVMPSSQEHSGYIPGPGARRSGRGIPDHCVALQRRARPVDASRCKLALGTDREPVHRDGRVDFQPRDCPVVAGAPLSPHDSNISASFSPDSC
jgi:hypothetical protein